ncbi:hypothetical protein [Agromyces sp. NPDC058104]|uniref:hypothetical protein n=1 Tax=Agromyces sp. NPDC058104 TaxID=3346342 RepID=UPI0036DD7933
MARLWFGNRRLMQWVKPYKAEASYDTDRYESMSTYLSGGLGLDASLDGHARRTLEWAMTNARELAFIWDYARGRYGDELVYWHDPMYSPENALNPAWSMPWLATRDAIPLVDERRPVLQTNSDFSFKYPAHGAEYTVMKTDTPRTVLVPIPPGHTAHVGIHGDSRANGRVKVTPYEGMVAGAKVNPTVLGVNTSTRVNEAFVGGAQSWIELSLDLASIPDGETDSFTLWAMIVQVLRTGQTPEPGDFITGHGSSGYEFLSIPPEVPNSAHPRLFNTTYTVVLGETGAWL